MTDLPDDITQRLPEGDRIRDRIRERREESDAADRTDDGDTSYGPIKGGEHLRIKLGARSDGYLEVDSGGKKYTGLDEAEGSTAVDADGYLEIDEIPGESILTTNENITASKIADQVGTVDEVKLADQVKTVDDMKLVDQVKTVDDVKLTDQLKTVDDMKVVDHKADDVKLTDQLKTVDDVNVGSKVAAPEADGLQTMGNVSKLGDDAGMKAAGEAQKMSGDVPDALRATAPADPVGDALAPLEAPADEVLVGDDILDEFDAGLDLDDGV